MVKIIYKQATLVLVKCGYKILKTRDVGCFVNIK